MEVPDITLKLSNEGQKTGSVFIQEVLNNILLIHADIILLLEN